MNRFFISYRRSEVDSRELAATLDRELRAKGHETFIDVSMPIGTDWVREISSRIDWCDFLIVLVSEGARTSEMVQTEVRLAHRRSKSEGRPRILPVRVRYDGRLDYELESYLGRIQYVTWNRVEDTARLLEQILLATDATATPFVNTSISSDSWPPSVIPPNAGAPLPQPDLRDHRRPEARIDARILTDPGDLDAEDPFYLERPADAALLLSAQRPRGETAIIKGARQMGKSALLIRYLGAAEKAGKKICFLDFTTFTHQELQSLETVVRELVNALAMAAGIDPPGDAAAKPPMRWIQDNVLAPSGDTFVLALDAVDRVLGREYQTEFFTMLRGWHNNRATDLKKRWKRLGMVLVISTEPYLLIDVEYQSPFNVVVPMMAESFTPEECVRLNELYQAPLSRVELRELYELVGGHPYLTRLAFYRLVATPGVNFQRLMEDAAKPLGPFGEHLKALLLLFHDQGELLTAYQRLIHSGTALNQETVDRLRGVGLVRYDGRKAVPANLLYTRFFRDLK